MRLSLRDNIFSRSLGMNMDGAEGKLMISGWMDMDIVLSHGHICLEILREMDIEYNDHNY